MGKKTVPIAGQIIPRKRAHIRTKFDIDALLAVNSFKTILEKKQIEKKLSGRNTYTSDKGSVSYQQNTRKAKTGYGNAYVMH